MYGGCLLCPLYPLLMEYIASNMTKGLVTIVASTVKNGNDRLRREICVSVTGSGQVGGFQTPGVCLQAFPSFLPHPVSLHFSRGLWLSFLVLCSETCTETLATQAMPFCYFWINILFAVSVPFVDVTLNHGLLSYSVMKSYKNPVLEVLSSTLRHCYSQYYRWVCMIKLVKKQSLILCNSKFTACVILKEN